MGEQKKYWEGKHFAFYTNKECEYYPCHPVPEGTEFNCLFCYCPLYMLGRKCGGNFTYLESGVKDCSKCLVPHRRENYGFIADSFQKIAGEMAEREKKEEGRTVNEGSSLYIPRCTWKKRPTAMRRRALF